MPKKTAPKTSLKSKFVSFVQNHRIWSVLIAAILVYGIIWAGMVGYERYSFYRAEKKLAGLASDLSLSLNKNFEKDRYCVYSSAKFEKGQLRCAVNFYLQINNINTADTNLLLNKLYETVHQYNQFNNKKDAIVGPLKELPQNEFRDQSQFKEILLTSSNEHPGCAVHANYQPGDLKIILSCYGDAKKEYFPVKE